jgi:hypothetical protein
MKPALKDTANPFFKSKYADLTSVWEACREALTKNGLSVVQTTEFEGDAVWIETILLHSSGESIKGRYPLRPMQQTPQGYGSALSYARRYSLAAMVGVVADDDDGHAASEKAAATNGAHHDEPPQSTMTGRKNEADGIKRAREWVNEAIAAVNKKTTMASLNSWLSANDKTLGDVEKLVPDEYAALKQRIDGATKRLGDILAAG